MHEIIEYIVEIVWDLWYTGIFIMMTLESSFFPFPSEVAMLPAGYLSATWEMNFAFALFFWTLWALVWASINYFLWYKLWGPIIKSLIHKYGKYFFIKDEHYQKTEEYFLKHGVITTFLARFITVIRQLISIPAGVFKMNIWKFLFYTGLWAWLWNLILMLIWYLVWNNQELLAQYTKQLLIGWIIFVVFIALGYILKNKVIKSKK